MSDDNGTQRLIADRYLLDGRLGRGGMGTVWRARDQLLNRTVALKEVNLEARGEESARQARRVHREARALARISHPHVVDIYDLVTHEGRLWLVMEFVDGPSLAAHVDAQGLLTPPEVAGVGLQILAALEAVHAAGALHRDVKPANILLRPDSTVVLCDFGIAAMVDTESYTAPDAVMGSLAFAAPERLTGSAGGPPSDLFSLGGTLCALVSGHSPFAHTEPVAVMHAVIWGQPVIPDEAGPLRPVLEALLRKDPDGRPSAAEAVEMLQPVAESVVASASSPGSQRMRPTARSRAPLRRRAVLTAALLPVVGVATGLVVSNWPDGRQAAGDAGGGSGPSREAEDAAPDARPTPVDAAMPTPDDPGQYWLFAGSHYIRMNISASGGPFMRREIGPAPIARWSGTLGRLPRFRKKIDATMPVPGRRGQYWVFSGDQYIRIHIPDQTYEGTLVQEPASLSDWSGTLGNLPDFAEGIDAVMPTPDDPQQFWVFRKNKYIRITLVGDGPSGHDHLGALPLAKWTHTFGGYDDFRSRIDATMMVPGRDDVYWVFSGGQYIEMQVSKRTYADRLLHPPRPTRNWAHLD